MELMNLTLKLFVFVTCKCLSSGLNGVRWLAKRRSRRTRCRPRTREHTFIYSLSRQEFTLS